MVNCQKLWNIWLITYLIIINVYLTVVSIKDYLNFKHEMFDLAYGGNWNMTSIYLILGCLNASLALFPIIIYTIVFQQNNLANDGHILGRDADVFYLSVNDQGKGSIIPIINTKQTCIINPSIRLICMELPPLSYLLQVISAMCFLIPKAFIDGHRIHHGVIKSNLIWHSDLDFLFWPDHQHSEFVHDRGDNLVQPVSVAYFNLGLSLVLLSLQYSRVLWHISKQFTVLLSIVMIMWSIHMLVDCSSVAIIIKISLNPYIVVDQLRLSSVNVFVVQSLSVAGNLVLLLSFTTVFHYGILQYCDALILKNRKSRRQMVNSSPQIITANHLDIPGAFSPSVSENNYSEVSTDPVFSKSHVTHIVAIIAIAVAASLKVTHMYISFVHLYQTTADTLTLTNVLISCIYALFWLILWFALALRRNWNFKIKSESKYSTEPHFLNGNSAVNHSDVIPLRQMQNSLLRNVKCSDTNLSRQEMMAFGRNVALDGFSDDTDMSSKLSSNNYVFLQSMRNGQMNLLDSGGQSSMLRSPLFLSSYPLNNQALANCNPLVYTNDDSVNNRSLQLDEQLGSEHSYNSNMSRNIGFESLPPILPNFDENRYRNPAAMEKLIPRYLRNQSLDYNNFAQFSMPNNEFIVPTVSSPNTLPYGYDTGSQNYSNNNNNNNIIRYKQSLGQSGQQRTTPDRFSILQGTTKSSLDSMDCIISDDDIQRRVVLSPVMFPTLEESITDHHHLTDTESAFLLPGYNNEMSGNTDRQEVGLLDHSPDNVSGNNNHESLPLADRMCSQV